MSWMHRFISLTLVAALAGCSGLPSVPSQPARLDLGSSAQVKDEQPVKAFPVLALADIQALAQNENSTAVLYRLGYADGQALHAYSQSRWSQPPALLVQQRLREILGQGGRVVLSAEGGVVPPFAQGRPVPVLQLALEELVHHFTQPDQSEAVLRIRATLIQPQRGADELLGQKVIEVRVPATASAAGGTQAMAKAVDQTGADVRQWLEQLAVQVTNSKF